MNISIKKLDTNKRQIDIEVPADIVKQKFDDVYARIAKDAKIPGFRPGKAPRDMVEKYHSKAAYEEVIKELIPETYQKAIEKDNIDVVSLPEISDVQLNFSSLKFKATVETRPEVKIKDYKNIEIKYKKVSVQADEVEKALGTLKEAKKSDALDDKFAKGLGFSKLSELREALEKQLFIQKEHQERQKMEEQIINYLIGNSSVAVSDSLVSRQLEELVKEAKAQLAMRGQPREEIEKKETDLRNQLKPTAEQQVKLFFIFDEIARKENLAPDNQVSARVMEFLLKEAKWEETV